MIASSLSEIEWVPGTQVELHSFNETYLFITSSGTRITFPQRILLTLGGYGEKHLPTLLMFTWMIMAQKLPLKFSHIKGSGSLEQILIDRGNDIINRLMETGDPFQIISEDIGFEFNYPWAVFVFEVV